MTWPEPPQPLHGFASVIVVLAAVMVMTWLLSPIFNALMRVLQ